MNHVWLAAKLFERQVIDKMRDRIFKKRLRGQTEKFHEENEKYEIQSQQKSLESLSSACFV